MDPNTTTLLNAVMICSLFSPEDDIVYDKPIINNIRPRKERFNQRYNNNHSKNKHQRVNQPKCTSSTRSGC